MRKGLPALGAALLAATVLFAQPNFDYMPPGDLAPGSGEGRADWTVYRDGMRFPLEAAPAYANSQLWGTGGLHGPPGDQCDSANYSYPWRDNYCETRTRWRMPFCPVHTGHQGQDIRPATCADGAHWAVAAEAGTITSIGFYSVHLRGEESGFRYRYLHLDHDQLAVQEGQRVDRGERIGLVSDNQGGSPTTIHLHFDMHSGGRYYPTYMSLVRAYETLLDGLL
ncbi:MAG: M23 family metallopeptidase [Rhodospirillaceae bacterium]|nr:M23 family metallopeptidase [Rhodospirillaceae bacterium]